MWQNIRDSDGKLLFRFDAERDIIEWGRKRKRVQISLEIYRRNAQAAPVADTPERVAPPPAQT